MQELQKIRKRIASLVVAALLAGAAAGTASGTEWMARAGALTPDKGNQVLAFLPNEFWIYVGCPGATPDGSNVDNSTCATSDTATTGQTYAVNFPSAGNFKLMCLVHSTMTGAIHVLPTSAALPYDQALYDPQADQQEAALLAEGNRLEVLGNVASRQSVPNVVTAAGISAVLANGGGSQTISAMRFQGAETAVHVGGTVEWTNLPNRSQSQSLFGSARSRSATILRRKLKVERGSRLKPLGAKSTFCVKTSLTTVKR